MAKAVAVAEPVISPIVEPKPITLKVLGDLYTAQLSQLQAIGDAAKLKAFYTRWGKNKTEFLKRYKKQPCDVEDV